MRTIAQEKWVELQQFEIQVFIVKRITTAGAYRNYLLAKKNSDSHLQCLEDGPVCEPYCSDHASAFAKALTLLYIILISCLKLKFILIAVVFGHLVACCGDACSCVLKIA